MVKRVLTSIITLTVLMGSVAACSGSDSEVAELRAELEEVKAQLETEETPGREPTPVPPTPTPVPIVPEPTPQTFFEYPKYGIAIDFSTNSGTDKFSRLVDCRLDWESLNDVVELIESEAEYYVYDRNPDVQHIGSTFRSFIDIWTNDDEGIELVSRLISCYTEFDDVFGPFSRFGDQISTPQMIYKYLDSCATVDEYTVSATGRIIEPIDAVSNKCTSERPTTEISQVNRAFKDLNDWSNEVLAVLNEE